jgi:hypothetical protein
MAWIAFGGACVYLFLMMAVRVASSFHTMLLETMLKLVRSFTCKDATAKVLTVHQWSFSPQTIVDAL